MPTLETAQKSNSAQASVPSPELAWTLGALAGKGYVSPSTGVVLFANTDPGLLRKYSSVTGNLFDKNHSSKTARIDPDGSPYIHLWFCDVQIARTLGDLRREKWPDTIIDKHRWAMDGSNYTWRLLEGFFDARGYVHKPPSLYAQYNTSYPQVGNFIADLLTRVGIKQPQIDFTKEGDRIQRIRISQPDDRRFFAQHIHSAVASKEEGLEMIRTFQEGKKGPKLQEQKGVVDTSPDVLLGRSYPMEDVLAEWVNIRNVLGRLPSSVDIAKLKRQGKTRFSAMVYVKRFGRGSFVTARAALEELTVQG